MSQTPQLKVQAGWFAAGAPLLQALESVSDGAFKLFVYLCLKADRSTAELTVSPTQLARALRKSRRSLSTYLGELQSRGLCQLTVARNQHEHTRLQICEVLDDGDQLTIPRFENVVEVRGAVQFETAMAHVEGKGVEYYIDHAGGYSRDADSQGATLIYPDGRRVLNKGGFLWFKTLKVPPMSVIEVPLRPVVQESSEPVLEGPSNSGAETDSSQRDREKEPSLDNP